MRRITSSTGVTMQWTDWEVTVTGRKNNIQIKGKPRHGLMLALLGVLTLLGVLIIGFTHTVRRGMDNEVKRYLDSLSRQLTAVIAYRNESMFTMLESAAAQLDTEAPLLSDESMEQLRPWTSKAGGFFRLDVFDVNGEGRTSDEGNIESSETPELEHVLAGERTSWVAANQVGEDRGLVMYAVPIYRQGKIAGALSGAKSMGQVRQTLRVGGFEGLAQAQLISSGGDLLVITEGSFIPPEETNFLDWQHRTVDDEEERADLEELEADLLEGGYGVYIYGLEAGEKMITHYAPTGLGDGYYLLIIPWDTILHSSGAVARLQIAVAVCFMVLCVLLLGGIWLIWRHERKRLTELAYMDSVTGGLNFQGYLNTARSLTEAFSDKPYTVVSFDISKFRAINDAFGNQAGNEVLRHVMMTAYDYLGEHECIGRIGADKFVMLVESNDQEALKERLTQYVWDINAFNDHTAEKNYLRFSFGIYPMEENHMPVVVAWDRANSARKTGVHMWGGALCSFMFYQEENRLKLLREKEIENTMAAALDTGAFEIYFQACYRLQEDSICAAEALVRWSDPKHGMLEPKAFLPILEKNGFIVRLDLYVFEQVCAIMQRWQQSGMPPVPISVNLSRLHLMDPQFLDKYVGITQKYGVSPENFLLELTESVVFENTSLVASTIDRMHEIGFRCVLDDFGRGFSSLNMLRDLHVDALKLDRVFFTGVNHHNTRTKHVVDSIIEMAQGLGMETVAEGVQTADQLRFLRNARCDLIQGDILAQAMPPQEFELMMYGKIVQTDQHSA